MQLFNNPWKVSSCLEIGEVAHAWLDARNAVTAAEERLELAKAQKVATIDGLTARLVGFSETVPDAFEKFSKAVSAALAGAKKAEEEAETSGLGVAKPFDPVDASAVEGFRKAVDPYTTMFHELDAAARELSFAEAGLADAKKAEREAFAAFREKVSLVSSHVSDAMGAVEEVRRASEQSRADAEAFFKLADALRKQVGKK